MRKYTGNSPLALKPKDTREVSEILKYCNTRRLAICTQVGMAFIGVCRYGAQTRDVRNWFEKLYFLQRLDDMNGVIFNVMDLIIRHHDELCVL